MMKRKIIDGEEWIRFDSKLQHFIFVNKLVCMVVLVLVLIVFVVAGFNFISKDMEAITSNPFVYGAKQMGNVQCSCIQYGGDGMKSFMFDDQKMSDITVQGESLL